MYAYGSNHVKYTIQQLPQRYARVAHGSNDLHRHGDLTTHKFLKANTTTVDISV